MIHPIQAVRATYQGTIVSVADFRNFYTWWTWLCGWLVRILCQVAFYSLIGIMVGDSAYVAYVVLGAAMMICVTESLMTAASTTWDRHLGTFPLLVGTSVEPGFFYFGRSFMWPVSGTVTTTIAVFSMSLVFGLEWKAVQVPIAVLLILLTSVASYCMALVVGAAAILVPGSRNLMSAMVTILVTAFCGAFVPVGFWPSSVQWAAQAVPVTHGLEALRLLWSGGAPAEIWESAGWTFVSGVLWFALAILMFRRVFAYARAGGRLLT